MYGQICFHELHINAYIRLYIQYYTTVGVRNPISISRYHSIRSWTGQKRGDSE